MSHTMKGHSRQMGHGREFWQNVIHWRREWQTTPVFWSEESHEQCGKDTTWEDAPHRLEGVQYATGE